MPIDFLAIGHITHDVTPDGFRLGGTVTYAAVTARRLGRRPAVLTRATADGLAESPLSGIPIHLLSTDRSTTFENVYRDGKRTQHITAVADPVTPADLPGEWSGAPVVLLGPIARETPPAWLPVFPRALLGMTPQGMMRRWDTEGRVYFGGWADAGSYLARADAIILSKEDVGGDEGFIGELAAAARLLVVTDGWHGAMLYQAGAARRVPPRPAHEVDPTGAGDVFATAFLVRLAETGSPFDAARFANVVASMSVEGAGMEAIPYREQVDAWLREEMPE